jgi:hypothetical protein
LDLALDLHAGGAGNTPNVRFPAVLEWLDKERQRLGGDVTSHKPARELVEKVAAKTIATQ